MSPKVPYATVESLMLQVDNSLTSVDGMELHFCLQNGKVHYEVKPCESELEEITETTEVANGGIRETHTLRHKIEDGES